MGLWHLPASNSTIASSVSSVVNFSPIGTTPLIAVSDIDFNAEMLVFSSTMIPRVGHLVFDATPVFFDGPHLQVWLLH